MVGAASDFFEIVSPVSRRDVLFGDYSLTRCEPVSPLAAGAGERAPSRFLATRDVACEDIPPPSRSASQQGRAAVGGHPRAQLCKIRPSRGGLLLSTPRWTRPKPVRAPTSFFSLRGPRRRFD